MRHLFKWLVYGSLPFLAWYLIREDLLTVPRVHSLPALLASLAFLAAGFLAGPLAWRAILSKSGYPTSVNECTASMGLSIFGKYIPGKLWVVLGRAAYVADRRGFPLTAVSTVSLNDQFLALWVGLVLGGAGLLWTGGLELYGGLVLLSWLLLSVLIFSPWLHRIAERLLGAVLRTDVKLPALGLRPAMQVLPWFLCCWLSWSVGFYLLARALVRGEAGPAIGLMFPLAVTMGIMAVLVPGGLGVREGVLAACLVMADLEVAQATTVALASRLWFVCGEVGLFGLGLLADRALVKARMTKA
jgi:hypothetical protein